MKIEEKILVNLPESYQKFLAELYQICGSLDHVDVKILDNLSAASRGICLPHKSILADRREETFRIVEEHREKIEKLL